jgi:hypothetical protein
MGICVFGAGDCGTTTKSSVTNTITNNTVNKNFASQLNKNVLNQAMNTLISNASTCSSSVNQNADCSFSNINGTGDVNLSSDQSNAAKVSFSCVNSNDAAANMSLAMKHEFTAQISNLTGTSAASELNAAAAAKNSQGAFATASSAADSSVNNTTTNNLTNETVVAIENVFETNLANNFSQETVSQCIGKTDQTLNSGYDSITGKNININCTQTNTLEQISNCEQLNGAVNKTVNDTFNQLGLTVATETVSDNANKASVESDASTKSSGIFQDIFSGFANIIGSIGGVISAGTTGWIFCTLFVAIVFIVAIWKGPELMKGAAEAKNSMGPMGPMKGGYSINTDSIFTSDYLYSD